MMKNMKYVKEEDENENMKNEGACNAHTAPLQFATRAGLRRPSITL